MTTADMLLSELEEAVKDLLKYGEHDGACTNQYQMSLLPKVAPCSKHQSAMRSREERVKRALNSLSLLRDVFRTDGSY